jgi:hypothetical protein
MTTTVHAYRFRRRDYTITQDAGRGQVVDVINSTAAIRALRKARLMPGAKVSIRVPMIVQGKRTRGGL